MKVIFGFLFALIVSLSMIFGCGCTTTKHINKEAAKEDSSGVKKKDSTSTEKFELSDTTKSTHVESGQNGVVFDSARCPTLPDIKGCDKDSLEKAYNDLNAYVKKLKNKVSISADGAITAEGNVKEAYSKLDKKNTENKGLSLSNQKLVDQHQTDSTQLKKSQTSKVVEVHRSGFAWWFLLIAFAAGGMSWAFFGSKVKALLAVKKLV